MIVCARLRLTWWLITIVSTLASDQDANNSTLDVNTTLGEEPIQLDQNETMGTLLPPSSDNENSTVVRGDGSNDTQSEQRTDETMATPPFMANDSPQSNGCSIMAMLPYSTIGSADPKDRKKGPNEFSAALTSRMAYGFTAATMLAMEHFNFRDTSIVPELADVYEGCDFYFSRPTYVDSKADGRTSVKALWEQFTDYKDRPCAVLAPLSKDALIQTVPAVDAFEIPLINYFTEGEDLSSATSVANLVLSKEGRINAIAGYFKDRRYLTIWSDAKSFDKTLGDYKSSGDIKLLTIRNSSSASTEKNVKKMKESGIKTIYCDISSLKKLIKFAQAVDEAGLLDDGTLFILPPEIAKSDDIEVMFRGVEKGCPLDKLLSGALVFDRLDGFRSDPTSDPLLKSWRAQKSDAVARMNQFVPTSTKLRAGDDFFQSVEPTNYASFAYDAVIAIGMGACSLQAEKDRLAEESLAQETSAAQSADPVSSERQAPTQAPSSELDFEGFFIKDKVLEIEDKDDPFEIFDPYVFVMKNASLSVLEAESIAKEDDGTEDDGTEDDGTEDDGTEDDGTEDTESTHAAEDDANEKEAVPPPPRDGRDPPLPPKVDNERADFNNNDKSPPTLAATDGSGPPPHPVEKPEASTPLPAPRDGDDRPPLLNDNTEASTLPSAPRGESDSRPPRQDANEAVFSPTPAPKAGNNGPPPLQSDSKEASVFSPAPRDGSESPPPRQDANEGAFPPTPAPKERSNLGESLSTAASPDEQDPRLSVPDDNEGASSPRPTPRDGDDASGPDDNDVIFPSPPAPTDRKETPPPAVSRDGNDQPAVSMENEGETPLPQVSRGRNDPPSDPDNEDVPPLSSTSRGGSDSPAVPGDDEESLPPPESGSDLPPPLEVNEDPPPQRPAQRSGSDQPALLDDGREEASRESPPSRPRSKSRARSKHHERPRFGINRPLEDAEDDELSSVDPTSLLGSILAQEFSGASGPVMFEQEGSNSRGPETVRIGLYNIRPTQSSGPATRSYQSVLVSKYTADSKWADVPGTSIFHRDKRAYSKSPRTYANENFISAGVRAIGLILMVLAWSVGLVGSILLFVLRNDNIIQRAQPFFMQILCWGSITMSTSIFTLSWDEGAGWSDEQLDISCTVTPWFFFIGQIMTFCALFTKLWRVDKVLQFRRRVVTISNVMKPTLVLMTVTVVILSLWTVMDPWTWEREVIVEIPAETYGQCESEHAWWYFGPLVGLLCFAEALTLYYAWKTADVPEDFRDSGAVMYASFAQLQSFAIGVPMLAVLGQSSAEATYFGRIFLIWIFAVSSVAVVVGPKVIRAVQLRLFPDKINKKGRVSVTGVYARTQPTGSMESSFANRRDMIISGTSSEGQRSEQLPQTSVAERSLELTEL